MHSSVHSSFLVARFFSWEGKPKRKSRLLHLNLPATVSNMEEVPLNRATAVGSPMGHLRRPRHSRRPNRHQSNRQRSRPKRLHSRPQKRHHSNRQGNGQSNRQRSRLRRHWSRRPKRRHSRRTSRCPRPSRDRRLDPCQRRLPNQRHSHVPNLCHSRYLSRSLVRRRIRHPDRQWARLTPHRQSLRRRILCRSRPNRSPRGRMLPNLRPRDRTPKPQARNRSPNRSPRRPRTR